MSTSGFMHTLRLPKPALQDNTADSDRLLAALSRELQAPPPQIDLELQRTLPEILRQAGYNVQCLVLPYGRQTHLLDVKAAGAPFRPLGLAVDLGSSRIVIRLLDLLNGADMGQSTFDNPQVQVGSDILTRIHAAATPDGAALLQELVIESLNQQIRQLCQQHDLDVHTIYVVSLAGNTAMTHLLLRLPCHWMIREPYIPAANTLPLLHARELGLALPARARLRIFPNIAAYFGGDLIAGILYAGLHQQEELGILVDVGTNAEVVLGNRDWLMACAGAAGPALESGVSQMGMMAGPGVIDQVAIDPHTRVFSVRTIDNEPPLGICGSGLIDLAAQLFLAGMLDRRGKLVTERCAERLVARDGGDFLIVVPATESGTGSDLGVHQSDLDSLMRAKAAMFTILETLTMSVGVSFEDLSVFYVAGTFGAFINPRSAITIGMLPDLPLSRYRTLGNSSLEGASLALTAPEKLAEIDQVRRRITYLELNVNQDFMNRFSAARFLPHTDWGRFPSVISGGKNSASLR